MVQVSYPGVYVQEIPSGVRTIAGVATSVTAFVGYTRKGTLNKAVAITSFADFERGHGGLDRTSVLSYAVRQFYLNGGSNALIVRVALDAGLAQWTLLDAAAAPVLDIAAANPGAWGNELRVSIDEAGARDPTTEFNLVISSQSAGASTPTVLETHRNLTMDPASAQYVESVVNTASVNVHVTVRPALPYLGYAHGAAFVPSADVGGDKVIAGTVFANPETVLILTPFSLDLASATWTDIAGLVTAVNTAIGTVASLAGLLEASEHPMHPGLLALTSLKGGPRSVVSITLGAPGGLAALLKLGVANGGSEVTGATDHRPAVLLNLAPAVVGVDGQPGGATELVGTEIGKDGMHALDDVDLFNLLVIPETATLEPEEAFEAISQGIKMCEARRAFFIVDPPLDKPLADIAAWAVDYRTSSYSAAYFPAVKVIDPLDGFRPRAVAPSGTLAGVYARTDATRGVWKAPAGSDATLKGVIDLALPLNDLENGQINPQGINALRNFPAQGRVAWGARTLRGSDALADEYKYIPIRRLALFIEESLFRGTQWIVFEPNDFALYAQIRLNIGTFMNGLFRQGAFQGKTPQEAYFVKCDNETTTQADRNLGIVNIIVGFAPLKPAEFVVLSIQQIAGDLQ